jgi:hypothetical protein
LRLGATENLEIWGDMPSSHVSTPPISFPAVNIAIFGFSAAYLTLAIFLFFIIAASIGLAIFCMIIESLTSSGELGSEKSYVVCCLLASTDKSGLLLSDYLTKLNLNN